MMMMMLLMMMMMMISVMIIMMLTMTMMMRASGHTQEATAIDQESDGEDSTHNSMGFLETRNLHRRKYEVRTFLP